MNKIVHSVKDGVVRYGDCCELVERCLSYFFERLIDGGVEEWAEIEYLCEEMGIEEDELKEVFNRLGYEEEM